MADGESISKLVIDVEVNDKKALLALSALQQRIKNFNSSNGGKAISDMASNMEKMTRNTAQARREAGQFIEQIKRNNKNLIPSDLYSKSMQQYQKELATAQNKMKQIMSSSSPDKQLKGLERYTLQAQMARNAISQLAKEQQKASSSGLKNFWETDAWKNGTFKNSSYQGTGAIGSDTKPISDATKGLASFQQIAGQTISNFQKNVDLSGFKDFTATVLKAGQSYSKPYIELEKQITKCETKLESLYTKQELMKNAKPGTERYQKLQTDIKKTEMELDTLNSKMKQLQDSGKDITSIPKPTQFDTRIDYTPTKLKGGQSYSKDYIRLTKEIQRAENSLEKLKFKQEMMKNSDPGTERYKTLQYNIAKATRNAEELARRMRDLQASGKDVNKVSIGKQFQDATKQADKMGSAVKKVVSALGKEVTKLPNKLMKSLLRLGTMFRAMILRRFIMQVFNSMKEAVDQLAIYSNSIGSDFNKNISTLVSDFKYLGRVIVTAFEPLINFAVPILDFLIQKVVAAINAVNQFISALLGNSTWTKANYNAENYAESLDKASGNAKKLKQQLQGFDELNNLSSNQGGSGGGASGGGANAGDLFSTQPINEQTKKLVDEFKEAWANADFTDIGKKIGKDIANALNNLPWDDIKDTADKIAKSLATFLNGFISPDLFEAVGSTLAEALNTVFSAANTFTNAFDWKNLGKSIASGINKFFKTFNFVKAGMTISSFAKGVLKALTNAIGNVDWDEIGKKLVDFFASIDWNTLLSQAALLIADLAGGLTELLLGALGELVKVAGTKFKERALAVIAKIVEIMCGEDAGKKVYTVGSNIVTKISEGIGGALQNAAEWIKTHFTKLITDISNVLSGESPKAGTKAVEGIKKGVEDGSSKIVAFIKKNVTEPITKTLKKASKIKASVSVAGTKSLENLKNLWDKFKNLKGTKALKATVSVIGKDLLDKIKNVWNLISEGKKTISVIFNDGFTKPFRSAWNNLANGINNFISSSKILSGLAKDYRLKTFANGAPQGVDHGTMFIAGEAGAEIVGNVGGRTEVLNQSQLASTMYSAVFSAIQAANGNSSQPIQVYLDGKVVFDSTRQYAADYTRRTGIPAF